MLPLSLKERLGMPRGREGLFGSLKTGSWERPRRGHSSDLTRAVVSWESIRNKMAQPLSYSEVWGDMMETPRKTAEGKAIELESEKPEIVDHSPTRMPQDDKDQTY